MGKRRGLQDSRVALKLEVRKVSSLPLRITRWRRRRERGKATRTLFIPLSEVNPKCFGFSPKRFGFSEAFRFFSEVLRISPRYLGFSETLSVWNRIFVPNSSRPYYHHGVIW